MSEVREVQEILAAHSREDGVYAILLVYDEGDAINATAQILRLEGPDLDLESVVGTNDDLTALWISPNQSLWATGGNGRVWTTAAVLWPLPEEHEIEIGDEQFEWRLMLLPPPEGRRCTLASAIWGTSDQDVHVGTHQDGLYHWNGSTWRRTFVETDQAINHIHGSGPNDVYAVGRGGLILHWEGQRWQRLPYPGDDQSADVLTGVRVVGEEVFVCGTGGRLLRGGKEGFEVLGQFGHSFYSMAHFQGDLYLAAGTGGALKLVGRELEVAFPKYSLVGVFENRGRLLWTEADQRPASIVVYDPADPEPWYRLGYPV